MTATPPWRLEAPGAPLFRGEHLIEGRFRRFSVWAWEGRLVFQDEERPQLWFATREIEDEAEPRAFWKGEVEAGRVWRAFSRQLARERQVRLPNGAALWVKLWVYDALVAQDNSGWIRVEGEANWRPLHVRARSRIARPGARRATIWSPHFRLLRVRGPLAGVGTECVEEQAMQLPPGERALWEEGHQSQALRAMGAAVMRGWTPLGGRTSPSVREFWQEALRVAGGAPVELAPAFLNWPGMQLEGRVFIPQKGEGLYFWHSPAKDFTLHVSFRADASSHHEQLEARLELRDFLTRFFPASQVEKWLR